MRRRAAVVACALLAAALACGAALVGGGMLCVTSAARPEDRWEGASPAPGNEAMLGGALDYVATRPHYRSAYYAGGWPDDGCGTCADVVAHAMLAAGYDLPALMAEDVEAAPEAYPGVDAPDPAIDWRRTANQQAWLDRHARRLPTGLGDPSAWRGGDVVAFDATGDGVADHVGIVSDRRGAGGVPYLVHHEGPFQLRYEEDVLGARANEVCGHWRLA